MLRLVSNSSASFSVKINLPELSGFQETSDKNSYTGKVVALICKGI